MKSVSREGGGVYSPPVLRLEGQSSSISGAVDRTGTLGCTVERIDVAIVGGGQAGLGLSHELSSGGIDHAVLERGRVGQTWRNRWDTFCLVTPNWTVQLPGTTYDGDDPDGFMPRDEIAAFLARYAESFGAPVREGVDVRSIESDPGGGFRLATSAGTLHAESLVLANGAFQRPHRPTGAAELPNDLLQLDIEDYQNAGTLPAGGVLVVGSGQSGCQVAEELREAGRDVVLACGRAAWAPRRIGDRDLVWWLVESGFLDAPVASLSSPAARLGANITATGHGGGHDLHLRTLRGQGVTLVGHFLGASGDTAHFAPDLDQTVAWSDDRYRELMALFRKTAAAQGLPTLEIHDPEPFAPGAPEELSMTGIGSVIFAGGFRPAYRDWLPWPDAFDDLGFPIQEDGASSVIDGLYFVGVHFLRKRKSSLMLGVAEDAPVVARAIIEQHRSAASPP
jgi:putative flavoprotein involved in K+ transport